MYFMGPIVNFIEDTSRHLLNEDTLFMYFWRYYLMKEVNEWTLSVKKISSLRNVFFFQLAKDYMMIPPYQNHKGQRMQNQNDTSCFLV